MDDFNINLLNTGTNTNISEFYDNMSTNLFCFLHTLNQRPTYTPKLLTSNKIDKKLKNTQ